MRINEWAEGMELLDDDQAGFCSGRSPEDATQVMMRMQEDGVDLRKRGRAGQGGFVPSARLLDLRKAYPHVNKAALWLLMWRYGMEGDFLRLLNDLHEMTEYEVKGRESNSDPWVPDYAGSTYGQNVQVPRAPRLGGAPRLEDIP